MELPKELIEQIKNRVEYMVGGHMAYMGAEIAANYYTAEIAELEAKSNGWNEIYLAERMEHLISKQEIAELQKELDRRTELLKDAIWYDPEFHSKAGKIWADLDCTLEQARQKVWQSYKEEHGITE